MVGVANGVLQQVQEGVAGLLREATGVPAVDVRSMADARVVLSEGDRLVTLDDSLEVLDSLGRLSCP